MEAIRIRGVAKHAVLTLHVPHQFDERGLEVIVLSNDEEKTSIDLLNEKKLAHQEKVIRLMKLVGTAKHPDAPIDKYTVYEQ